MKNAAKRPKTEKKFWDPNIVRNEEDVTPKTPSLICIVTICHVCNLFARPFVTYIFAYVSDIVAYVCDSFAYICDIFAYVCVI